MGELIIIAITAALLSNVVLSQFLGICSFLGVSTKTDVAVGMGGAVVFVITVASAVAYFLYLLLDALGITYLDTIVFILVIAALVQIVESFFKKYVPSLYKALGVYLPLITTNCTILGVTILNLDNGYSFIESIVCAAGAGWKTIWLNRRGKSVPEGKMAPDVIVGNDEELYQVVKGIVGGNILW